MLRICNLSFVTPCSLVYDYAKSYVFIEFEEHLR